MRSRGGVKAQPSPAVQFEEAVKDNYERIFNFVFFMVGDREEAADLTQETFVRAYAAFADFRGESTVGTWLSHIARNLTINRLKQKQVEKRVYWQPSVSEDGEFEDWEEVEARSATTAFDGGRTDPLARMEAQEVRRVVRDGVNELPPEYREVILLRDMEGHSYLEMTEILGCSMEAVKSRLFRARTSLKERLRPYFQPKRDKNK